MVSNLQVGLVFERKKIFINKNNKLYCYVNYYQFVNIYKVLTVYYFMFFQQNLVIY